MEVGALHAQGDAVGALGRAGLLATATLYAVLALLALRVALEGRVAGHRPDSEGALRLVAEQPVGVALLALLGLGFAAQVVWRLAQAVGDRDREGDAPGGIGKRIGYACIAVWYAVLAGLTAWILFGGHTGGSPEEQDAARGVLEWPLGRDLVIGAGLGFVVAAVVSIVFVAQKRHLAKLRTETMSEEARRLASAAGLLGHSARALVFAVIGAFLVKAAWDDDPTETVGLDGALLQLAQAPLGAVALSAVALGFGAFSLWCVMQARYRAT